MSFNWQTLNNYNYLFSLNEIPKQIHDIRNVMAVQLKSPINQKQVRESCSVFKAKSEIQNKRKKYTKVRVY